MTPADRPAESCRCSRAPAAVCALFAALAAAALLAQDACLDAGGRVSDSAWACEMASGASASLWTLVGPAALAAVALVVGLPVYLAADAIVTIAWKNFRARADVP